MSSSIAIQAVAGVRIDRDDTDLARTTMRRVSLRLLPFLFVLYVCNFLDRTNVAIAALQMNRDLHFSATAYGFGAGIFSLGYPLFRGAEQLRARARGEQSRPFCFPRHPSSARLARGYRKSD